jgi:hypothetical protein
MKRFSFLLLIVILSLIPVSALSAQKITPGSTCKVLNQKVVYQSKTYTCIKSGKKLIWNKGIVLSRSNPSTVPQAKIPNKLTVVLKFSNNSWNKSMWMTSYYLHCTPLLQLPPGQYEYQHRLVNEMPWANIPVKIFNGRNELIGTPDNSPSVINASDGSCSLTYEFTYLNLEMAPLIMKSGTSVYWTIPFSDWMDGIVYLGADTADFRII